MGTFFNKYKVLLFGLLAAVALPVNDLITLGGVSTKTIVFAAVTAALTFAARNLRGQWATIAGLLGTTVTYYLSMDKSGDIEWGKIVMFVIFQVLAIVAPPAKSVGYERTDVIEQAKQDGENKIPSPAEPKP